MPDDLPPQPRRRARYAGTHPRRFNEKYKEHAPEKFPEVNAAVQAGGRTPAGTHRPIMVAEVLEALSPRPGECAVDCTLGYGGHAAAMLGVIAPHGTLLGLDVDPLELPRTAERLRGLGFGPDVFTPKRSNFAGLARALGGKRADVVMADLGVSSMQLDDPARGFGFKADGPLDMRMNPERGEPASALLARLTPGALAALLIENADEPRAAALAHELAGKRIETTGMLAAEVRRVSGDRRAGDAELAVRRVFQALRIAVNDEFPALDMLLRTLPDCVAPGGRVAFLTFHSGEDRRVKHAFAAGLAVGLWEATSDSVIRAGRQERFENPRSGAAKLRWARRASVGE